MPLSEQAQSKIQDTAQDTLIKNNAWLSDIGGGGGGLHESQLVTYGQCAPRGVSSVCLLVDPGQLRPFPITGFHTSLVR